MKLSLFQKSEEGGLSFLLSGDIDLPIALERQFPEQSFCSVVQATVSRIPGVTFLLP